MKFRNNSFIKGIRKYITITIGTLLYGLAISIFLDPNNLAPGGVTGIAVILNRFIGIPTGSGMLLLNIPILLAGLWKFGLKFLISTVYATFSCSLFTNLFSGSVVITENPFLAAIAGGGLMAVGLGMVFRAGATTGGTDIIIKFLRLKYRHLKTGRLFFLTDIMIVAASLLVFDDIDTILFAMMTVIINSRVLDVILYGGDEAKLIYIISDRSASITERLLNELNLGVTHLLARGAYSRTEKDVIMCVLRNTLAPKVEEIVKEEDPLSFMIVSGATEIYGTGYKNIMSEKL